MSASCLLNLHIIAEGQQGCSSPQQTVCMPRQKSRLVLNRWAAAAATDEKGVRL